MLHRLRMRVSDLLYGRWVAECRAVNICPQCGAQIEVEGEVASSISRDGAHFLCTACWRAATGESRAGHEVA